MSEAKKQLRRKLFGVEGRKMERSEITRNGRKERKLQREERRHDERESKMENRKRKYRNKDKKRMKEKGKGMFGLFSFHSQVQFLVDYRLHCVHNIAIHINNLVVASDLLTMKRLTRDNL